MKRTALILKVAVSMLAGQALGVDTTSLADRFALVGVISDDSQSGKAKTPGIAVIKDVERGTTMTLRTGDQIPHDRRFSVTSIKRNAVTISNGSESDILQSGGSVAEKNPVADVVDLGKLYRAENEDKQYDRYFDRNPRPETDSGYREIGNMERASANVIVAPAPADQGGEGNWIYHRKDRSGLSEPYIPSAVDENYVPRNADENYDQNLNGTDYESEVFSELNFSDLID